MHLKGWMNSRYRHRRLGGPAQSTSLAVKPNAPNNGAFASPVTGVTAVAAGASVDKPRPKPRVILQRYRLAPRGASPTPLLTHQIF
jgi:hypothetical protein